MIPKITLPSVPTKRETDPSKLTVMIYGDPGVGKTTFAASAKDSLILATEPGYKHLDGAMVKDILHWTGSSAPNAADCNLMDTLDFLIEGDHPFKHIVIDTVDDAYAMCLEHECALKGIAYPGADDPRTGKSNMQVWSAITQHFRQFKTKLKRLSAKYGVLLICHAKTVEEETRTGPRQVIGPALGKSACIMMVSACDLVLYAHVRDTPEGSRRAIQCHPGPTIMAKDRTGRLPAVLPLSWEAVTKAIKESK